MSIPKAKEMKDLADKILSERSPEGQFEELIAERILKEASDGKKLLEIDWPKDITNVPYSDTAPIVEIPQKLRNLGYEVFPNPSYEINKLTIKWRQ
jgi:hypothetical protein